MDIQLDFFNVDKPNFAAEVIYTVNGRINVYGKYYNFSLKVIKNNISNIINYDFDLKKSLYELRDDEINEIKNRIINEYEKALMVLKFKKAELDGKEFRCKGCGGTEFSEAGSKQPIGFIKNSKAESTLLVCNNCRLLYLIS